MSIINKSSLIGYWNLDGHALDMSPTIKPLSLTPLINDANLVGYWKLENVNDSKNSYNLTNTDAAVFESGLFSNCVNFGTGLDKALTSTSDMGITTGNLTMSCWVKMNEEISSGNQSLFSKTYVSGSGVSVTVQYQYNSGTRRLQFWRGAGSNVTINYNIDLGISRFHHIAFVYDGTNFIGYVNGVNVGSLANSGTQNTLGLTQFELGKYYTTYSKSKFDDVSLFSRALSDEEIKLIYNKGVVNSHGTVTGATVIPSQNPAIPASLAYKFNGASRIVGSTTLLDFERTESFSISAWIYKSATATQIIFGKCTVPHPGYFLFLNSSNQIGLSLRNTFNTNELQVYSTAAISPDRWTHIVATYSGGSTPTSVLFYINGSISPTNTSINNLSASIKNSSGCGIGDTGASWLPFTGKIQEVAIFNKALSTQEIQTIYNQTKRKYTSKSWLSGIISAIRTSDFFQFFFK